MNAVENVTSRDAERAQRDKEAQQMEREARRQRLEEQNKETTQNSSNDRVA